MCFINSGQTCAAWSRLLVPRSRLEQTEQIAMATAGSMRVGSPFDDGVTLGPLASAAQRDRVERYIQRGLDDGARVIAGGPGAPPGLDQGYYVRPTVFSDVSSDMVIAREEIFGPVLSIIPFEGEDEAVLIANDSDYGLSGAVWAGDDERARRVARRIRAGQITVNGGPYNQDAPFGGFKQSGIGRELERFGLEEFTEIKSIFA